MNLPVKTTAPFQRVRFSGSGSAGQVQQARFSRPGNANPTTTSRGRLSIKFSCQVAGLIVVL